MTGDHQIELTEIPPEECLRLLSERRVGRLALVEGNQPLVLPVNYVLEGDTIVFRTDEGLKLRLTPLRRVAFEVDEVDESTGTGWSVLVQGPAYDITRAIDARSEALRELKVTPFAPGTKDHWIKIVGETVTGRRLSPAG